MYNSDSPLRAELPSSRQLLRSTAFAAVAALVLLGTVVLPAEYGIDPTGTGRVLGLTDMGLTKMRLAAEAAEADAPAQPPVAAVKTAAAAPAPVAKAPAAKPAAGGAWRDEMSIVLAPGQGAEVKMRMNEGDKANYAWTVAGGTVNYDAHADGEGRSVSYGKGRGEPADQGELVAAFAGNHGWFWRNRTDAPVTVTLRTAGDYAEMKAP